MATTVCRLPSNTVHPNRPTQAQPETIARTNAKARACAVLMLSLPLAYLRHMTAMASSTLLNASKASKKYEYACGGAPTAAES